MANRQDLNAGLQVTSFLYGGNAAYIEDLQARYEKDPASVEAGWREFFATLGDDKGSVVSGARGGAWKRADWPVHANGEMVSALDGNWPIKPLTVGKCRDTRAPSTNRLGIGEN